MIINAEAYKDNSRARQIGLGCSRFKQNLKGFKTWLTNDFLAQFNISNVPDEELEELKDQLWSFRHIFFNEATPQQFEEGIRADPVKIRFLPGQTPKRERARVCPDSKLEYLRQHVDQLTRMGVFEEIDQIGDVFASPVHVVVEQRFIAAKNTVEEKTRLCVDARNLNAVLGKSSYPLPDCSE